MTIWADAMALVTGMWEQVEAKHIAAAVVGLVMFIHLRRHEGGS